MVDEKVVALSNEFTGFWNGVFARFPQYQLDYSWPSVGTLDYLLYSLRRRQNLSSTDQLMLKGAAAYLCRLAHDCWKAFPDGTQVNASCSEAPFDILLTASFGEHLPKTEYFVVSVYRALAKILSSPENPLPCFGDFAVPLAARGPLIPFFAMGLCSGLCPYGRGRWREKTPKEFAANLMAVAMHLAESSAAYYTTLFPLEPRGQSPRLYSSTLIFPPPGFDEPQPYCRAAASVAELLRADGAGEKECFELARNLAMMPDPLCAGAGFAFAAALQGAVAPESLIALADAHGTLAATYRPAVQLTREVLSRKGWLDHYFAGELDEARGLIGCELDLNLLPLVEEVVTWRVGDPAYYPLFEQLASFRPVEADEILTSIDAFGALAPDLWLQQIALQLYLGRFEEAERRLESFAGSEHIAHDELRLTMLDLEGRLAEAAGLPEKAKDSYEKALSITSSNTRAQHRQQLWLANRHAALGNVAEAERLLTELLTRAPSLHSARISYLLLLESQDRVDEVIEEQQKALKLVPNHYRTHAAIKAYLLQRRMAELKEEAAINEAIKKKAAGQSPPIKEEEP